jgi:hypothetical protein
MLGEYLNQKAILMRPGIPNKYGESTYQEFEINCRYEKKTKLIRNSKGEQVVSNSTILTDFKLEYGDIVDNRIVESINDMTGLEGEIIGYEGALL